MKITRNNYEVFFIDYVEKKLPAETVAELYLFLENNPDLKEEFELFRSASVQSSDIVVFRDKESLKKPIIDKENAMEMMLAAIDDMLSPDELASLKNFLQQQPALMREYEMLKRIKLSPKPIFYSEKRKLRRKGIDQYNYQTYLIAEMEGDLDEKEKNALEGFLAVNPALESERKQFRITKLISEELKYPFHKSLKKPLPLFTGNFYRYAAAACVLIAFGLYFFSSSIDNEPQLANSDKMELELDAPTVESDAVTGENKIPAEPLRPIASTEQIPVSNLPKSGNMKVEETTPLSEMTKIACSNIDFNHQRVMELNTSSRPEQSLAIETSGTGTNSEPGLSGPSDRSVLASLAKKNLEKLSAESHLASNLLEKDKKGGRKIFEILAKGVGKITNDKVKLSGKFTDEDELSAYKLESSFINIINNY